MLRLNENGFHINKIYNRNLPFMVVINVLREDVIKIIKSSNLKMGIFNVKATYYHPVPICFKCSGINLSIDECKSKFTICFKCSDLHLGK